VYKKSRFKVVQSFLRIYEKLNIIIETTKPQTTVKKGAGIELIIPYLDPYKPEKVLFFNTEK
jgi:hypothetical protein